MSGDNIQAALADPATVGQTNKVEKDSKFKRGPVRSNQEILSGPVPKKVQQPNKQAHDSEVEELTKQIEKLTKEWNTCKDRLSGVESVKGTPRQQELKKLLIDLGKKKDRLFKEKTDVKAKMQKFDEQKKAMIAKAEKSKGNVSFATPEKIDEKITELENKLSMGNCSLLEEKQTVNEINNLKKSKKQLFEYQAKVTSANESYKGIDELKAENQALSKKLDEVTEEQKTLQNEMDELKKVQDVGHKKLKDLRDDRDKAKAQLDEAYQKRRDAITNFRNERDAYAEYANYERAKRNVQREESQKQRELEIKAIKEKELIEKLTEPKYGAEIEECKHLVSYLSKTYNISLETAQEGDGDNTSTQATHNIRKVEEESMANVVVLKRKDERESEDFYAATKTKKRGGKKEKSMDTSTLKFSVALMESFTLVKVPVPSKVEQIKDTIKALQVKGEEYKEKQKTELEKGKKQAEELKEKMEKEEKNDAASSDATAASVETVSEEQGN